MHTLGSVRRGRAGVPPVDVGLGALGQSRGDGCGGTVKVKDGKFVVMNKGKP